MSMAGGLQLIRTFASPAIKPGKLRWGNQHLWIVDHATHEVLILDSELGLVVGRLRFLGESGGIALVNDEIWVVDPASRLLQRLRTATGEVTSHLALPIDAAAYGGISVTERSVWVHHDQGGMLMEIARRDGVVLRQLQVDAHVADLQWREPSLMLLDSSRAQLLVLNPEGVRDGSPYQLNGTPTSFCCQEDKLWVHDERLQQIQEYRLLR